MKWLFWTAIRNLIAKQLALTPNESRNEIRPDMLFDRIDGIDQNDLRDLHKDVTLIFGMNGAPPPRPTMGLFIKDWETAMKMWLFRRGFGEPEAAAMIHDFIDNS